MGNSITINNNGGTPNPINTQALDMKGDTAKCCAPTSAKAAGPTTATSNVNKTTSPGAEAGKEKAGKEEGKPAAKEGNFMSDVMGFMANLSGGAASPLGGMFGMIAKALIPSGGGADAAKQATPKKPDSATIA
jgi:hypothetical protein